MKPETAAHMTALNHQFYQTFSADFSATRQRLQPGVLRALANLPAEASILDVGCGNGLLARWLAKRGHRGPYVGLDFSDRLLATARVALDEFPKFNARLEVVDLIESTRMGQWAGPVDRVYALAVLHHLPGEETRLAFMRAVGAALKPEGQAMLSNWQFLTSEKLRSRIVPWEQIGLTPGEVDPGDYLLDWRRGGVGYRYVHYFSEDEIGWLAEVAGLRVVEHFYSDGGSGTLGLYTRLAHTQKKEYLGHPVNDALVLYAPDAGPEAGAG